MIYNHFCHAGRSAFYGGRWRLPCPEEGVHVIGSSPGSDPIVLCDRHFHQVAADGLVTNVNIGPDEFERQTGLNPDDV